MNIFCQNLAVSLLLCTFAVKLTEYAEHLYCYGCPAEFRQGGTHYQSYYEGASAG